ncbi:LuxR C-terminal-related transcriptional regulator [Microbacterium pseudoresistens]|uniref:DNA-binding CsgD family transcriptional regulator n=1 Tax=Microbacterium pseudoresistens TaxID=640634 RepID=A0A7Y9ESZ6_9MICO|nr:LuxR C-terminal-related transcriptional regulator [Microbacterium pseudoresistens]NYD53358.1 DNA-binding CsgD family transcriptional regulator [Microbacterium pseudoresistens]
MNTPRRSGSDRDLLADAVRELARLTGFPVTFGGLIEDGEVNVTSIVGTRTRRLEGLKVQPLRGLGGRALTELRPRMTRDYRTSPFITHDYDGFVLGEGLRTLLAVPVVVGGRSRGVLYAGAWEQSDVGGVSTVPAMRVAETLGAELRIRDEVDDRVRRLALSGGSRTPVRRSAPASESPSVSAHVREELRESFAELRSIAAAVADPQLRERIDAVQQRIVALTDDPLRGPVASDATAAVHLSPRETDVLACVALGASNAQVAAELGLRESTVKAYLGSAMSKLDASTRHAAVARARRAHLLP